MNKLSISQSFAALAVAAVLGGSLVSCGDDEEGPIVNPDDFKTKITDRNGNAVLVTSVGSYRFTYDESGKLTSMNYGGETYSIQGENFSFRNKAGSDQVDFFFGSDGCITKIKYTMKDEYESGEGTVEYSYSNHRLKSASYAAKSSGKYDTFEESGKANYTWKDGNLLQVTAEGKESGKEDGKSYSESYKSSYTFTYGSQANTTKQFPYYMGEDITLEDNVFCVLGFFGYGPEYLPTGYTETYIERGKTETHTNTLSFTQNSNGTLSSETRNGSRINYTYNNAPTRADAVSAQDMEQHVRSLRFMFRHRKK